MGSVGANSNNSLSTKTNEQLDRLYESAAASKDRELMKSILTELASRPSEESSRNINYTSTDIRRRGARGRK